MFHCYVVDVHTDTGYCDEPATHRAQTALGNTSVYVPVCERHAAELLAALVPHIEPLERGESTVVGF